MLPTEDPLQSNRPTQTETQFPSKCTGKKAGEAILILDKIDFKKSYKKKPNM